MSPQAFEEASQTRIASLIPCRRKALEGGTKKQTRLFAEKYWDLLSFYEDQWHYITTIKIEPILTVMPTVPEVTRPLLPGQNIEYQGRKGYVIEALEKNQYWVRLHPHPTETHYLDQAAYVLACGSHLTLTRTLSL